jgi:hypothetical protein
LGDLIETLSHIDKDDKAALYCYVNQWNDEGKSMFYCPDCTLQKKKLFGCGYDENRGQGQLREAPGIDTRGICPGWWRNAPIVDDILTMRDYKNNLGHPLHIPQRLIECLRYLENQETIYHNRKVADMEKK